MTYLLPALVAVGAAAYLYASSRVPVPPFGGPVDATVFPTLLGLALTIGAGLMLIEDFTKSRKPTDNDRSATAEPASPVVVPLVLVATVAYILLFEPLGYILSTSLYLGSLIAFFHRRSIMTAAAWSMGFAVAAYLVMAQLLGVGLPSGPFP